MKVIVQIPCFNEEKTLPQTIADIPRQIEGVDSIEILVIDDGSSDNTSEVARAHHVEHIIRHRSNRGLATSFQDGVDAALRLGADIIVNTDGDNQYCGKDIPRLIGPILRKEADVVVGDREILKIQHFPPTKKFLSRLGSLVVRQLANVEIPDAVSGFRAISKEAALRINTVSSFSYTIEMLLQCGRMRLAVVSVPVGVNTKLRESRLFRSVPQFVAYSVGTILRIYTMVRPLRVFLFLGGLLSLAGVGVIARFLVFYVIGNGDGHIQSLIIGSSVLVVGIFTFLIGIVADLISFNRQLIEGLLRRAKIMELEIKEIRRQGEYQPPEVETRK